MLKFPYQTQERGLISSLQLIFLIITLVISTADVFPPAYLYQEARQDSWLSVIFATVISIMVSLVFLALALKYPGRTFVQYSSDILGNILGKAIGLIFVFSCIFIGTAVIRQLIEIFITAFNPDSPKYIYAFLTLLVSMYSLNQGIEVIARVTQLLLPIGLVVVLFIGAVNIPQMDFNNYLPILGEGVIPPLRGSLVMQGWLCETAFIMQIIPFVKEKSLIKKSVIISLIILGVTLMSGVSIIAVFGPLTGHLLYPALEYVRYATLGKYIQNLDIVIMGVWITGMFIKFTILYYISVHGLSQIAGAKSYKPLIIPVAVLIYVFSVYSPRILDLYHFAHYISPFFSLSIALVIPLVLLIVSAVKKKSSQRSIS